MVMVMVIVEGVAEKMVAAAAAAGAAATNRGKSRMVVHVDLPEVSRKRLRKIKGPVNYLFEYT